MIKPLNLIDHPEGGRFREIFRSPKTVTTEGGQIRSALTHIYFSLDSGEVSRFHRVSSDEVWNLYRGTGLRLYTWDGTENLPHSITLSAETDCFCHVVPAGTWQAAEPLSDTVLVGCSVAPGFEFADFELMRPDSDLAARLNSIDPALSRFTGPWPTAAIDTGPRQPPPDTKEVTMKMRKKFLDYEYEEVLDVKTRELIRVACAVTTGCPDWLKKHFAVAKEAGATEAELKEAMAYGMIAPSGRAKNFALRMKEELGLED